mgnify:CR=1 FL=1
MSLLKVNNLRKKYKARTVVHDVSFDVGSGEVVGLLGPNGAGKTTCFYMIVGLVAADGGEITLDDEVLTHRPIHQRARLGLSYLPQEMSVFRKLTVAENIQAVLELQNLTKPEIAARLEELLGELGIEHLRDNTAISLSGGERRRCEIARALATQPEHAALVTGERTYTRADLLAASGRYANALRGLGVQPPLGRREAERAAPHAVPHRGWKGPDAAVLPVGAELPRHGGLQALQGPSQVGAHRRVDLR